MGRTSTAAAEKKAFKCCSGDRLFRTGVVAASLEDLVDAGCKRLKVPKSDLLHLTLEDGTIVDDDEYFHSLPANTAIYFVSRLAAPSPSASDCLKAALEALASTSRKELLRAIRDPLLQKHVEILQLAAKKFNLEETKDADPDWFEGILTGASTKSQVMEQSAKRRIRDYLFEVRRKVQASGLTAEQRRTLLEQLSLFQKRLSAAAWHGHYFSRKRRKPDTFCDDAGRFDCEGTHSKDSCEHGHLINPYSCKEDRIMFSTWNLDHQIEKSRQIVPEMLNAAAAASRPVNWDYFYDVLFTRHNLRLVHTVCHDKREHKKFKCDTSVLYA